MSHVRIVLPHQVGHRDSIVELDGKDITRDLRGFKISANAKDDVHKVELELNLPTLDVDAQMRVAIAQTTTQLLESLGWAPPEDAEPTRAELEGLREQRDRLNSTLECLRLSTNYLLLAVDRVRDRWADASEEVRNGDLWIPLHQRAEDVREAIKASGIVLTTDPATSVGPVQ